MASTDTEAPSRYIVGIDLGTTNSAVAYVDTLEEPPRVRTFAVPQLIAPGQVEARDTLPSFHYEAAIGEFAAGALALPWNAGEGRYVVGFLARDAGELSPGRLISSAKSWLSHAGIDRSAELLPWHGAEDVARLSPVEAGSRYVGHIRDAWNHLFPAEPLAGQDVVLTLPASFDEVARELTVKAAQRAGLPRVVLVEEPQAAFYAWIDAHGTDWEGTVRPGQKILVCDIGGGTTDFTLIRVRGDAGGDGFAAENASRQTHEPRRIQFHRVAVGEHLILGGDNLDLALAHHVERRLMGDGKLPPRQWSTLVQSCRRVKETLLSATPPERMTLNIAGSGSRLIGGGTQVELTREETRQVLIEGFLPRVGLDDKPAARRSGFQEFGLPYAADAAMTRYLAVFLTAHRHAEAPVPSTSPPVPRPSSLDPRPLTDPARPDIVLFNGGFFESPLLRERLLEVLCSWFTDEPGWRPLVLENVRLDQAVARGAAYYGLVRRGRGVRIAAGLARSYYIGVEAEGNSAALCLAPAGIEEGQEVELPGRAFSLRIREPVEFPLYVSSTRLTDRPGALVPVDREQLTPLPPVRTVLTAGKKGAAAETLAVTLHARLTEIGTLDVWCRETAGERSWRLQFDVRSTTQTDVAAHQAAAEAEGFVDEGAFAAAGELLRESFGLGASAAPQRAEGLVKALEQTLGMRRAEWPSSLLRRMWELLFELEQGRAKSAVHEARWLYLVGFSLRPGYGLAVDDWRVAQTWRLFQARKLLFGAPMCRVEWLILWRRIAGGLTAGQQRSLADPLVAALRPPLGRKSGGARGRAEGTAGHEAAETWRLLGALELLGTAAKVELGGLLLPVIERERTAALRDAQVWAVGRLGARVPMYAPLNVVPPPDAVRPWLRTLMADRQPTPAVLFAVMQLARRTGDRYRDLPDDAREDAAAWLSGHAAGEHLVELVRGGGELEAAERGQMFGESLPRGLRLV